MLTAPRIRHTLALLVLLASCADDVVVEPVTTASYFVRNDLDVELSVQATDLLGRPIDLLTDRVPPHQEVRLLDVSEGSGGHAMPSNFFGSFEVTDPRGASIYSGVDDSDWPPRHATSDQLVLHIDDRDGVDAGI